MSPVHPMIGTHAVDGLFSLHYDAVDRWMLGAC